MTSTKSYSDWRELDLAPGGRSLIEASAGTGKTWTISVLYLRLLLEQKRSPKRIVVTTFTDAAAQELRERIRERILWALGRLDGTEATPTPLPPDAEWLQAFHAGDERKENRSRLVLALAELDLAPIGTLHSLCRRILGDFPLECGTPFDPGELVDSAGLRKELLDDLWRRLVQSPEALSEDDQVAVSRGRSELADYLGKALMPDVRIAAPAPDIETLLSQANARRIQDWVDAVPFKRSNSALRSRLLELVKCIELAQPDDKVASEAFGALGEPPDKYLKPEGVAHKNTESVLALAREVAKAMRGAASAPFQRALARYQAQLREQSARRLSASGQLTFDDLIARVHAALHGHGHALANRLFEEWPVALVDEFQDTDAQQYGILDRIYRDAEGTPRGCLVMIGDPKQAIYRFRGGDIDAYLAARESAIEVMKLGVNFRSSTALVTALNGWHAMAGEALSTDPEHDIRYEAVSANGRDDTPYCVNESVCEGALQIHYDPDPPESQGERRAAALGDCARRIVELLSGGHCIGDRPLVPGDIAVLLPSHGDIAQLRALLQERDVPCVSSSRDDVFGSDWARELQIVLHAALHPRDEPSARAALATQLGGRNWSELSALAADPDAWQREAMLFRDLDALWRTRGVLAVVRRLIERASPWLFERPDQERALTDLRHLGELLQAQSDALPGRDRLLAWLADQREGRGDGGEAVNEKQLRIESDAARVTLMTLHASKGLEFNVVLLPLMWANTGRGGEIPLLHDEVGGGRVIEFGEEAHARHAMEGQNERFRLLYVALTRARYACHVHALPPGRPKRKGANEAEVDPQRSPLDAMIEKIQLAGATNAIPNVSWSEEPWFRSSPRWSGAAAATEAARKARDEPDAAPFEFRYSFSALSHGARGGVQEETAASDESLPAPVEAAPLPDETEPEHAALAWLAPVAGTEFGNAVHAVFEHRRLDLPLTQQQDLIRRALRDEHVRAGELAGDQLVEHLAQRLQAVLETPLLSHRGLGLLLGDVPARAQRAEMEFDFVLDAVSLRELRRVCDFVPGVSTHELRGLMNGKIDLVLEHAGRFHVLDYKTNRLGAGGRQLSAYAPERLETAMDHSHYRFQALLYTIAVDRYLRQRVPDYSRAEHLGEAIYLFVRAVGIAPQTMPKAGIWAHRFDEALLEQVDQVFRGRGFVKVAA